MVTVSNLFYFYNIEKIHLYLSMTILQNSQDDTFTQSTNAFSHNNAFKR